MSSKLDMQTENGETIDALITFEVAEGQPFVAALEVSGVEEADEVKFRMHTLKLMWDGMAFTAISLAFLASVGFAYDLLAFKKAGWIGFAIAIDVFALVIFSAFYASMKKSPRYRYIFAIEQFKRYRANEQWIVIDEAMFESEQQEEYNELKRQCITTGIGLMVVHSEEQSQILFTPTRVNEENMKLDWKPFIPNTGRGSQFISQLTSTMADKKDVKFYQRGRYSIQKLLISVSFLVVLIWVYKETLQTDVAYSENTFIKSSKNRNVNGTETYEHMYEDVKADANGAYVNFEDRKTSEGGTTADEESPDLYMWTPGGHQTYDCERIHDELKGRTIIRDSEFRTFEAAKERIESIKKTGLQASCMSLSCLSSDKVGYIVFIEWLFEEESEATEKLENAQKTLIRNNALKNDLHLLVF